MQQVNLAPKLLVLSLQVVDLFTYFALIGHI